MYQQVDADRRKIEMIRKKPASELVLNLSLRDSYFRQSYEASSSRAIYIYRLDARESVHRC